MKRIKDTGKTLPKLNPIDIAKALGASEVRDKNDHIIWRKDMIDDKTLDRLLSLAKKTSPTAWVPTRLTPKEVKSLVNELKAYREPCENCGAPQGGCYICDAGWRTK